ncbi:MAG: OsmC family protein [Sphaerochaetaceae bacterium]
MEFTTQVQWTHQRKGKIATEGMPTIEIASPVEFNGHPGIWSPEHLFVGAAEVCLMTTFLAMAEYNKLKFLNYSSKAVGVVDKSQGSLQVTKITIYPLVVVESEELVEAAFKTLDKAKRHCLISASMKTEVSMEAQVEVYHP